jgi:hypothetical protein
MLYSSPRKPKVFVDQSVLTQDSVSRQEDHRTVLLCSLLYPNTSRLNRKSDFRDQPALPQKSV